MGSSVDTIKQVVLAGVQQGERIGVIQIRLYRPFPSQALRDALPATVTHISVLDRTKSRAVTANRFILTFKCLIYPEGKLDPTLSRSLWVIRKSVLPRRCRSDFHHDASSRAGANARVVVGIEDDVSQLTLPKTISATRDKPYQSVLMYGYGGDGSVSAGKNLIKP